MKAKYFGCAGSTNKGAKFLFQMLFLILIEYNAQAFNYMAILLNAAIKT